MPRQARIDAPGVLQQVIIRGIEKKTLFRDDRDREVFLARLKGLLHESAASCYAWALLPGQVQLLLRTGPTPLATIMRRLLTGYARYFNQRHRLNGRVFQDRYKSVACEEKPYFQELVRAIHLAPVQCGLVKTLKQLGQYPYGGHSVLVAEVRHDWQDQAAVLARFGITPRRAWAAYEALVREGFEEGVGADLGGGGLLRSLGGWSALKGLRAKKVKVKGDERILGGGKFVEKVLSQADAQVRAEAQLKRRRIKVPEILRTVARYYGVEEKAIKSGSKARSIACARSVICALGVKHGGLTGAAVARELKLTPSAISKAVMRGETLLGNRRLARDLRGLLDLPDLRMTKGRT